MKKNILIIIFLFAALYGKAQTGALTVNITNINEFKGQIRIGLFNNDASFPVKDKEYKKFHFTVTSLNMKYLIPNLSNGSYAIALYHDANNDDVCNLNFFGMPTEGYGFSNNPTVLVSAPSFSECKFKVAGNTAITIKMKY
jgi:uncharacterized protein (DUF2141 family)